MATIAVIGAGIVGASVAYRLAQQGAEVRIIERGRAASGTTAASFAWANANQKTPRDYFELNYAGMREHARLRDEFGSAPWLHDTGNLIWAAGADEREELEQRVRRLREWGYAAEWRGAAEVKRDLEPGIAFPAPDTPVAFFPEEAWVDAPALARALLDRCRDLGAGLHEQSGVEAIEMRGGRVSGVRLGDGTQLEVDAVVNAAGPGADQVARLLGLPLPLAPTRGLLVRVATSGDPLGRIMHSPEVNARPDGPGHVLIHHDTIDRKIGERAAVEPGDPLCAELLARARRVIPALGDATIDAARIGVRPYPEDGRSCVGAVSAAPGYYEAVTHSGVTLGPLLGRLLAAEILRGEVDPLLAPFRPDRFPRQ